MEKSDTNYRNALVRIAFIIPKTKGSKVSTVAVAINAEIRVEEITSHRIVKPKPFLLSVANPTLSPSPSWISSHSISLSLSLSLAIISFFINYILYIIYYILYIIIDNVPFSKRNGKILVNTRTQFNA
jgi:hypothetical protein